MLLATLPLQAGTLERALMPGAVIAGHQKYEADCELCHSSFDKERQPQLCLDCHQDIAADIDGRRGLHGRQSEIRCAQCHGEHLGVDASIAGFDQAGFDHARTDFPLSGRHAAADCDGCHRRNRKYREASGECVDCHRKDDRHETRLGQDCGRCHGADDWRSVGTFDHALAGFKLAGAHARVECKACHVVSPVSRRLGHDCRDCHQDDDAHQGSMGSDCAGCHLDSDWKSARFDHGKTGYPLLGRHRDTACAGCHKVRGEYRGAAHACSGCHRGDDRHRGTLGERCDACHDSARWKPAAKFDHANTSFPLLGGHVGAACSGCHADAGHYAGTAGACVDCHRMDDSHQGRNGPGCADCHDAGDWKRSLFDHDRATRFVLLGAHRNATCESCHKEPLAASRPGSTCVDCHAADDVHRTRLGEDCARCHGEQEWKQASYQHDLGHFPLVGGHRLLGCTDCHRTQLYADVDRECRSCHLEDDPHAGRFGADCARCHGARDWKIWDFDHAATDFALTGAHRPLRCAACHAAGTGAQLPRQCSGCHDDVHDGGFGNQCARCHDTDSFTEIVTRVTGKLP